LGFAPATNPVLVNNSVTDYRWLDYYQKLMNWSGNAASAHDVNIEWSVPQAFPPEEVRKVIAPPSTEAYMYDADGNLVQDAIWTYEWDAENRLVSMSVRSGLDASIPRRRLEFAYDYASRRVEKKVFNWSTAEAALVAPGMMLDIEATGAAGEVEDVPAGTAQSASGPGSIAIGGTWLLDSRYYFVWDGWNLSMELDGDMTPIRSYGWGLDLSRSEQGAGGVGGLLFETLHTGASAGTYHTTYDGNGNLASLRNSGGLAVARYEYGPFGETVTSRDVLAGVNPFRFSTKYQDAETGLLYYGYRYYSAGMGRWLSRDPIGEAYLPNLHSICSNNLVQDVDVAGLTSLESIIAIHAANELDKQLGCGITIHQNDVGNGYGHRWIRINDPGPIVFAIFVRAA
jgi:RHS repeat-associated protein